MSIVAAAIIPHSPMLVPQIAGERKVLAASATEAIGAVAQEIHAQQAETVILFTPHGPDLHGSVGIYDGENVRGDLREFGDISAPMKVNIDHKIVAAIKDGLLSGGVRFGSLGNDLDYAAVVALRALNFTQKKRMVIISTNGVGTEDVIRLGDICGEAAKESNDRVVVLASGDMARRDDKNSAETKPTKAEKEMARAITEADLKSVVGGDKENICGYAPITALLSVLQGLNTRAEILNFSVPFGVGLLVAKFTVG